VRRVLLFAGFLLLLGLTTAAAASFDVQAEDITSFSVPVEIIVDDPTERRYYLVDPSPSRLSTTPEGDSSKVHSMSLEPGGILDTDGLLANNASSATYQDWISDPMPADLNITSPTVELYITQTGADGLLLAGLFECAATCVLLSSEDALPDKNLVTISFPAFSTTIESGNRLLLRVVNSDDKAYNIQWGYKLNRPARLLVDVAPA
jgi:hypothetical protein